MFKVNIPKERSTDLIPGIRLIKTPILKKKTPLMALTVAKQNGVTDCIQGVVREITERLGRPSVDGFLDRSKLVLVESKDLLNWKKRNDLKIAGIDTIINSLKRKDFEFIGLEDPDIYIDKKDTYHLFFTIAFKTKVTPSFAVFLGHAQGKSLNDLVATNPVLSPVVTEEKLGLGFKEASFIPKEGDDAEIVLSETGVGTTKTSVVAAAIKSLAAPWEILEEVLDPDKLEYAWVKGEVSPGPIFLPEFIEHKSFLVGFLNGRSKSRIEGEKIFYGTYAVGLMLIDSKTGRIPWISPLPLISDPEAESITFASDFVQIDEKTGILYAHVDDSFVRGYIIDGVQLKKYLINNG